MARKKVQVYMYNIYIYIFNIYIYILYIYVFTYTHIPSLIDCVPLKKNTLHDLKWSNRPFEILSWHLGNIRPIAMKRFERQQLGEPWFRNCTVLVRDLDVDFFPEIFGQVKR